MDFVELANFSLFLLTKLAGRLLIYGHLTSLASVSKA
jgi:hypothetical protein